MMFREGVKPVGEVWEGPKCKDVSIHLQSINIIIIIIKRNTVSAVQEGSPLFSTIQKAHSYSFE